MSSDFFYNSSLPSFILFGFFGTDATNPWMSIPLCFSYVLSVFGNCLIMFIVKADTQLCDPMYRFLAVLAVTDLGISLSTVPTVFSVLFFNFRQIHFYACVVQMYIIHVLSSTGSAILVAMAFDRFVAICHPLRYASIMHPKVTKIGLAALLRGGFLLFPLPFLLKRLPYCGNNKLYHAFCFHPDVMKLACADTTLNSIYGLVLVLSTFLLDSLFILLSYVMILRTALNVVAKDESLRAFSTCFCHICVVMVFYIPLIGLTMTHRYGQNASPLLHVLMGLAYLCIPPMLNPMIYGINTKPIRTAVGKHCCMKANRIFNVNQDKAAQTIFAIH